MLPGHCFQPIVTLLHSLALSPEGKGPRISSLQLLGHKGQIKWRFTQKGLEITLPAVKPCEAAFAIKLKGEHLQAVK
jgi:hypothetical protein